MAAGVLQRPGSRYGPCESECSHRDCALTRRMAAFACVLCDEPIGYNSRFYNLGGAPNDGAEELVHAACAEREQERAG